MVSPSKRYRCSSSQRCRICADLTGHAQPCVGGLQLEPQLHRLGVHLRACHTNVQSLQAYVAVYVAGT